MDATPNLCGIPLKWISLVLLTFQTSWQAFAMKIARSASTKYLNSTVVLFAEWMKLVVSLVLFAFEDGRGIKAALREVVIESRFDIYKTLMLGVPALAYAAQNNLIFISLDKLSAAVQQVTYQMKILVVALLSVTFLGRTVTCRQWVSLVVLVLGVVLVQHGQLVSKEVHQNSNIDKHVPAASVADALIGFAAVVAACVVSGFAGVFMEKVLKSTAKSIWLRNVQLAFFGCLMALGGVAAQDFVSVKRDGFTQGYNVWVWVAVVTTSQGGLLVAVVLKYADNILRQFSTVLALIITAVVSATVMRDVVLDMAFVFGTVLTIVATFAYNGIILVPDYPYPRKTIQLSALTVIVLVVCISSFYLQKENMPGFLNFSLL